MEQNLDTLLGVTFLASEYATGKTHGGRIDTPGIDENGFPVIIEYKRERHQPGALLPRLAPRPQSRVRTPLPEKTRHEGRRGHRLVRPEAPLHRRGLHQIRRPRSSTDQQERGVDPLPTVRPLSPPPRPGERHLAERRHRRPCTTSCRISSRSRATPPGAAARAAKWSRRSASGLMASPSTIVLQSFDNTGVQISYHRRPMWDSGKNYCIQSANLRQSDLQSFPNPGPMISATSRLF